MSASRRRSAMRLGVLALVVGVLHVTLSAYACGDPVEGLKSEGEPCTRSSECASELACAGGVCRGFDAGPPPPPVDGGRDLDAARDGAIEDGAIEDGSIEDGAIEDAALEDAALEDAALDDAGNDAA